jgi:hypothetical protein
VKGLAVPGMPACSPGMEGSRSDAYSVIAFDAAGHGSVYQKYAGSRDWPLRASADVFRRKRASCRRHSLEFPEGECDPATLPRG